MKYLSFFLSLLLSATFVGCDSYVEDVDEPIDSIDDTQLTIESQVPFLIKGVQSRFSTVYDQAAVFAGGLSDELIFTEDVVNATFPTFREMEDGDIEFANNSNDALFDALGELRLFSDNLLIRIEEITFEDADLRTEAEFNALFYGGLARYFYATYYGLTQREGGGVISEDSENLSPFIPSSELYLQAMDKLTAAQALADPYYTRVINTVMARIQLFQGNYAQARTAAEAGLVDGDAPFESLHSIDNTNYFWTQAGAGRNQWVVDFRFVDYVEADPNEVVRIPLTEVSSTSGTAYFRQNKYPNRDSPLPFATWQENELMLAELDLRDANAPGALIRINAIRGSHGLADLGAADMTTLIDERDKELFTMGLRLVDQRRMDLWHLGPDTWWFLPITQSERNINTNF